MHVHVCRGNFLARSRYSAPPTRSWHGIERGCTLTFLFCFSVNMRRTCRPTFPSSSAASSWRRPGPADPCTCSTTRAVGITMSWSHACPYIYVCMYVLIVEVFNNFTFCFLRYFAAWWVFSAVGNYAARFYRYAMAPVRSAQKALQKALFDRSGCSKDNVF